MEHPVQECAALRSEYEKFCAASWVRHFDRKRKYEAFKREVARNEAAQNDELKKLPQLRTPQQK